MYEKEKVCRACGGACCKRMAGINFPIDFGKMPEEIREAVKKALLSGDYAIDWWVGKLEGIHSPRFVRPRHKGFPRVDPSWGGECVFLKEDGCALNAADRPLSCKVLEPDSSGECINHLKHSKKEAAKAWIPFQDLLREMEMTI